MCGNAIVIYRELERRLNVTGKILKSSLLISRHLTMSVCDTCKVNLSNFLGMKRHTSFLMQC